MGGIFGVASKESCVFDLFFESIIIPIWEPGEAVWRSTAKEKGFDRSITISRIRRFGPSLSGM